MEASQFRQIYDSIGFFLFLGPRFHILHIIFQNNNELRVCVKGVLFN